MYYTNRNSDTDFSAQARLEATQSITQISSLTEEVNRLHSENSTPVKQLFNDEQQITGVREELQQMKEAFKQKEREVVTLQQQLLDAKKNAERQLMQQKEEHQIELAELQLQHNLKITELAQLRSSADTQQDEKSANDLVQQQVELTKVIAELDDARSECTRLRNQHRSQQTLLSHCQLALEKQTSTVTELNLELAVKQRRIDETTHELTECQAQLNVITAELQIVKEDSAKKVADIQMEYIQVAEQLEQTLAEAKDNARQIHQAKETLATLERLRERDEQLLSLLSGYTSNVTSSTSSDTPLRASVSSARSNSSRSSDVLSSSVKYVVEKMSLLQQELIDVKNDRERSIQQANVTFQQLESMQQRITLLEGEISTCEQEKLYWETECMQQSQKHEEELRNSSEMARSQSDSQHTKDLIELQQQINSISQENKLLRNEIDEARKEFAKTVTEAESSSESLQVCL